MIEISSSPLAPPPSSFLSYIIPLFLLLVLPLPITTSQRAFPAFLNCQKNRQFCNFQLSDCFPILNLKMISILLLDSVWP